MNPIDHHIKLFDAIINPLKRSSDELWAPVLPHPITDHWPEPDEEKRDDEALWREKF